MQFDRLWMNSATTVTKKSWSTRERERRQRKVNQTHQQNRENYRWTGLTPMILKRKKRLPLLPVWLQLLQGSGFERRQSPATNLRFRREMKTFPQIDDRLGSVGVLPSDLGPEQKRWSRKWVESSAVDDHTVRKMTSTNERCVCVSMQILLSSTKFRHEIAEEEKRIVLQSFAISIGTCISKLKKANHSKLIQIKSVVKAFQGFKDKQQLQPNFFETEKVKRNSVNQKRDSTLEKLRNGL